MLRQRTRSSSKCLQEFIIQVVLAGVQSSILSTPIRQCVFLGERSAWWVRRECASTPSAIQVELSPHQTPSTGCLVRVHSSRRPCTAEHSGNAVEGGLGIPPRAALRCALLHLSFVAAVHSGRQIAETSTFKGGVPPSKWAAAPALKDVALRLRPAIEGAVLVGHGLRNDLRSLGVAHPK
jgi:hypothetical protein